MVVEGFDQLGDHLFGRDAQGTAEGLSARLLVEEILLDSHHCHPQGEAGAQQNSEGERAPHPGIGEHGMVEQFADHGATGLVRG